MVDGSIKRNHKIAMTRMVPRVENHKFSQKAKKVVGNEDEDKASQTPVGLDNDT